MYFDVKFLFQGSIERFLAFSLGLRIIVVPPPSVYLFR